MKNIEELNSSLKEIKEVGDTLNTEVYVVKNKNNIVAKFKWVFKVGENLPELIEDIGLPSWVSVDFVNWVSSRTSAKHREKVKRYLEQIGLTDVKSIIDMTYGLSLNDSLWIVKERSNLVWEEVNLYNNEFSEVISRIAFTGGLRGLGFSTTVLELSTNGVQEKCWVRMNSEIVLLKEGSEGFANTGNEPYSEVMASQVLDKLGYNHVKYKLLNYHKKVVSCCKLFTTEDIGFVSFSGMYGPLIFNNILLKVEEAGLLREFCEMMILDYIIFNPDRHLNNFGFLVDNNTYDILRFAPLFDHGYAMLNFWMVQEDIDEYIKGKYPSLSDDTFEDVAKRCKNLIGNTHNVESLINFKFDKSKLGGCGQDRIDKIEKFINARVNSFLSW